MALDSLASPSRGAFVKTDAEPAPSVAWAAAVAGSRIARNLKADPTGAGHDQEAYVGAFHRVKTAPQRWSLIPGLIDLDRSPMLGRGMVVVSSPVLDGTLGQFITPI